MTMNYLRYASIGLALLLLACSRKPTAEQVAKKLTEEGIFENCEQQTPKAISARASSVWFCDLPSVPGKGGQVLSFETDEDYQATVDAFKEMAMLAGSHRYGNADARIFVQLNEDTSLEVGKKTKVLVEGL